MLFFHPRLSCSHPNRRTLFDHLFHFRSTLKSTLNYLQLKKNLTYSLYFFLKTFLAIATFRKSNELILKTDMTEL